MILVSLLTSLYQKIVKALHIDQLECFTVTNYKLYRLFSCKVVVSA